MEPILFWDRFVLPSVSERQSLAAPFIAPNAPTKSRLMAKIAHGLADQTNLLSPTFKKGMTAHVLSATRGGRGSGTSSPYVPALGDLVLSGALVAGVPSSGTILNATTGSAIVSTVSGLTVNSTARTYSYNGSGLAGSMNNGLTETLAGATFSPRGNVVTIVSAAVPAFTSNPSISPQGGNVGGTFSGIDGAMSNGGSILSRRWLLNGTSIGSGTTVVPASAGSLIFESTGTGNVVASSSAVTIAAVAGTPSIAFAAPPASVTEGDSGTKTVANLINVTRNGVTGPLTVNLSYSGTMTSGTDYVAGPVSATIADGQSSLSFDLTINGDTGVESDETVVINAVLDGYSSATASKTITVTNDDVTSTPGGAPTITGTSGEGNRLVADPYLWTDSAEYRSGQWYRDGAPVTGATFRSYKQTATDNGKAFTYTAKSRLNGVQRTTAPSAAITPTAAAAFSLDQFPAGTLIDHDPTFGVTADGTTGAVSAWAAKRGTGTFTQATAANMPVLRVAELGLDPAIYFGSSSTVGRALVSDEADSGVWIDTQIIIRGGKEASNQPSVSNNNSVYNTRRAGDQYAVGFTTPSNNSDANQVQGAFSGIGGGANPSSTSQFIKGQPSLVNALTQPTKRKTSVNGASVFSTPLAGTSVASGPTIFGATGTSGPIMSVVRRLRLSLDTLAGTYTQLTYSRLLEGHLAWRYGIQAMLPSDHVYAGRAPSAADFVNEVANVSTWGNSLTNGMSIHISNGLACGDVKGNYLYNGGVRGETAA